ncbi:hypothetical protein M405DRAFT_870255 [Rhizopogon salebrosus TDB-379]|nr:hypothetical protein M405DRAFT_870255 [Rhizopogon salebrosus TDB-379]
MAYSHTTHRRFSVILESTHAQPYPASMSEHRRVEQGNISEAMDLPLRNRTDGLTHYHELRDLVGIGSQRRTGTGVPVPYLDPGALTLAQKILPAAVGECSCWFSREKIAVQRWGTQLSTLLLPSDAEFVNDLRRVDARVQ